MKKITNREYYLLIIILLLIGVVFLVLNSNKTNQIQEESSSGINNSVQNQTGIQKINNSSLLKDTPVENNTEVNISN